MPSVKMPRKSTETDMTPFVDIAFLILTFFIMATKFKPPEPVTITTPSSVSSDKLLTDTDALLIEIDKTGRVFFTFNVQKNPGTLKRQLIKNFNDTRKLGLTENEIRNFEGYPTVGASFAQLKQVLSLSNQERGKVQLPGVPVDSTNNELELWIRDASSLLADRQGVEIMIKADNDTKFPAFKSVVDALRKNNQLKYQLITMPEGVPPGTELYRQVNER
jgi:biopolymer transport protein ExbD